MVAKIPTAAERYFSGRAMDPEYVSAYGEARRRIDLVDNLMRALESRRTALGMTKAELARRSDLPPEAIRRLFTVSAPNPTIGTLTAVADALGLDLLPCARSSNKDLSQH